jgi:hypothetical protein
VCVNSDLVELTTGTCNAVNGCGTMTTRRPCNRARCVDANTFEQELGCSGNNCVVRTQNCPFGCTTVGAPGCVIP